MKYCEKCGKELFDEVVACPGCGCPVEAAPVATAAPKKKVSKKTVILSIIGAVVALAVIVVLILFLPRNVKLEDLQETNAVMNLIRFGSPDNGGSGEWIYNDIQFEGITVDRFGIEEDGKRFYIVNYSDTKDELVRVIREKSDHERSNGLYEYRSYGDLEITLDPDGSYISFEVE